MRFVWGYTVMRLFGFYGGYGIGSVVFGRYRITVQPQNLMTLNTFRLQNYCIFPYFALLVGVNFMLCRNLLIINMLSVAL